MKEERKHFDMLKSVESFDASLLKKTNTVEKSVLPNIEGWWLKREIWLVNFVKDLCNFRCV